MRVYLKRMRSFSFAAGALLFLLLWGNIAEGQTSIQVTGKITVKDGSPAPGVSVVVKGTTNGVSSDGDGAYRITVPNNGVLVFSQIGAATQEIAVNRRNVINVVMEDSFSQLNEVVVVGYGTQKKVNLTGAVKQVSGEDLTSRPVPNITGA